MSVLNRFNKFFVLLLSFSNLVSAASVIDQFSSNSTHLDEILQSKQMKSSRADQKLANNIASLYDVARKGYPNTQIVKKLIKDLNKNTEFEIFKVWAQNILTISQSKTVGGTKNFCENLTKNTYSSTIESTLLINNQEFCFNKFLSLLSKNNFSDIQFKEHISLLSKHINLLLTRNNEEDLAYFLVQLKSKPKHFKSLSEHLSNYYIANKVLPSSKMLQYIDINHSLTKYIQIKGLDNNSTANILNAELAKLIKDAYVLADKESSSIEIDKSVLKVINYFKSTFTYLPQDSSSTKILGLGKSLMRREHYKSARLLYSTLIEQNAPNISDAYFESLWTYINAEKYNEAYSQVISKYNLIDKHRLLDNSKLSFWIGLTLLNIENDDFKKVFEFVIQDNPLSYYSIIASKKLQDFYKIPFYNIYLKIANQDIPQTNDTSIKLTKNAENSLKRLKLWGDLDYKPLIRMELDHLRNDIPADLNLANKEINPKRALDITQYLSAKTLKNADNYLESFKVVYSGVSRRELSLSEGVLDLLYPKPYWDKINRYTKGFDPVIALSLIRQESAFNLKARSHVGARGLMQIMPNTGKQLWRRLNDSQLYNPTINIKIGTKYLSNLMKRYDDNLVYTLSAYNAGESRVKKWRKEYLKSDSILHNIENIPFSETRKYVKLIFRNIFFYKLKNDSPRNIELAETKKVNQLFDIYLGFNQ